MHHPIGVNIPVYIPQGCAGIYHTQAYKKKKCRPAMRKRYLPIYFCPFQPDPCTLLMQVSPET
jgi:hypothetical protein